VPRTDAAYSQLLSSALLPQLVGGAINVWLAETGPLAPEHYLGPLPECSLGPRHTHPGYEVCWVLEGRFILRVGGQVVLLQPGDACIVRPGEQHQQCALPSLEDHRDLWWQPTVQGMVMFASAFAGQRRRASGNFVPLETPIVPLFDTIVQELEARRPRHDLLVRTMLLEVLARVLRVLDERAAPKAAPHEAGAWNLHVERLLQHLKQHHGPDVSLEQLAAEVSLSPRYLTTLFRRRTGHTVMAYLNEVRHREARSLLLNTHLDIAAVARKAGFDDPSYFSRVFKEREGCSPLQYRNMHVGERIAEPSPVTAASSAS